MIQVYFENQKNSDVALHEGKDSQTDRTHFPEESSAYYNKKQEIRFRKLK